MPKGVYVRTALNTRALTDRALDKVIFDDGCWEWAGAHTGPGYGKIREGGVGSPLLGAPRVIYEICKGPIPGGLQLDHLCRNRGCVRPDHLEPVTQSENISRGYTARRTTA